MKYRNKVTGAEFESACVCKGENWEQIEAPSLPETDLAPAEEKPAPKRKVKK